jgi:hypothetical protein
MSRLIFIIGMAVFSSLLNCLGIAALAQVVQPFPALNGGGFIGDAPASSPDPLVNYFWRADKLNDSLQYFVAKAVDIKTEGVKVQFLPNDELLVEGTGNLRFDFGREYAAWFEFDCEDLSGQIEMSISEYNEPAILNQGAQHPRKTAKPVKYGSTYRLELNDKLYEGLRFSWIHIRAATKPIRIKKPRLICQVMPVNYTGSFETDDSVLNKIWYTGAYTVRLNLLPEFFGAILMERSDRHSWTGDAYPAQAAALTAFGNYEAIRKNILYTSKLNNGIASYSMYWVLSLVDYYQYTGDKEFLLQMLPTAHQLLTAAYAGFDQLPPLVFSGWDERLGAGFERPDLPECKAAYRLLCLNAWKKMAAIAKLAGADMEADLYMRYFKEKLKLLTESTEGKLLGIHSVSNAVNAGLLSFSSIKQKAGKLFSDRQSRLSYSPFNQYFILQAMAGAGRMEEALTTARDHWGGQLAYGGTTFFEVYRPSWNNVLGKLDAPPNNQCGYTSLAHPWGAGITQWLTEHILGLRPAEPGFKAIDFIPFTGNGISRVKGAVPFPGGVIQASFDAEKGTAGLSVPFGLRINRIGFPLEGRKIKSIKIQKDGGAWTEIKSFHTDSVRCWIENLPAGQYAFSISFAGQRTIKGFDAPLEHRFDKITFLGVDSTTQGNWRQRYGKDGYLLAGPKEAGQALQKPHYIDSVKLNLNGTVVWDSGSGTNLHAAFITRDPLPTLQTMTIDVHCEGNKEYELSLYFLDWNNSGRRSAIELFDPETLDLLAPVLIIKGYQKGKYWKIRLSGSVRIRLNQVRGENVALAGLFFDPSPNSPGNKK